MPDKIKSADELIVDDFGLTSPVQTLSDRILYSTKSEKFMSGFDILDSKIGGFATSNTYVVGGPEKSGKSDFMLQMAFNLIDSGIKIGYLNTELSDRSFMARLASRWVKITKNEAEESDQLLKDFISKYEPYLLYAGVSDLNNPNTNLRDFKQTVNKSLEFINAGAKILFFDNLTTFSTQANTAKAGWEILAQAITQVVNFSKLHDICSFIVVHTKPQLVFSETPTGVKKIIEDKQPEKFMKDSATLIRKPTTSDLYGGGSAISQISGSILIWRPFQKFNDLGWQKLTMVCLDTFRDAPSGFGIQMNFDGAMGTFTEDPLAGVFENNQ